MARNWTSSILTNYIFAIFIFTINLEFPVKYSEIKNVLARIIQITQLSRMSSHYVKTSQSVFSFKACIRLQLQRVLYWMVRIQVLLMWFYISFPKANFIFSQNGIEIMIWIKWGKAENYQSSYYIAFGLWFCIVITFSFCTTNI